MTKKTPIIARFDEIRATLPADTILFFRLGDFYETFGELARIVAPLLDVALTKRREIPMAGIPAHALDSYLSKLVRAGKCVALAEESEISRTINPE